MSRVSMVGFDYPQRERICVTQSWPSWGGGSLGLEAVIRGSSSLGWWGAVLGSKGTGGPFKTCLHQRFEYTLSPALAPGAGRVRGEESSDFTT